MGAIDQLVDLIAFGELAIAEEGLVGLGAEQGGDLQLVAAEGLMRGGDLAEVAVVGGDHVALAPRLELLAAGFGQLAEAGFEAGVFAGVDQDGHLAEEVVEGSPRHLQRALVEPDVVRGQVGEAAFGVVRNKELDLAAGGLGRMPADLVQVGAEILGVDAAVEEGEELLALDDGGVALLDARHELQQLLRRLRAELEEGLQVAARVRRTRRFGHAAVNGAQLTLPGD